jgi:hypothetical protein
MASDIMIDIECLDTSPYCVILTIGIVRFDPYGDGVVEKLTLRPTIEDQTEKYNRLINDDTIRWWSEQSPEALEEAMSDNDRISFKDCMEEIYKYGWNRRAVWSHGAPFDVVAIETGMRQTLSYPNPIPWPFYTVRDTRTLYDIAKVKLKDGGHVTSHRAVDDAERQAIVVQQAYKKLGLTRNG